MVWRVAPLLAILAVAALSNALSRRADYLRFGESLPAWKPFVWEYSSVILIGALIPVMDWLSRRFPLLSPRWRMTVPIHLLATLPFSVIHVAGMVGLRKLAYALAGSSYQFGPVLSGWLYEYRKDFVTYWMIALYLCAWGAWRHWQAARAGAPAAEPDAARVPHDAAGRLARLVVRKHNREFILDVTDIARLEAAGNYVTVHTKGTDYRLRGSLAGLVQHLDGSRFVQVHRSQVVNIDHVREIQPWAHGDYRVLLDDGSFVNFSRRYRSQFDRLFGRATDPHVGQDSGR
jgi:hypothetical protein